MVVREVIAMATNKQNNKIQNQNQKYNAEFSEEVGAEAGAAAAENNAKNAVQNRKANESQKIKQVYFIQQRRLGRLTSRSLFLVFACFRLC